MVLFVSVSLQIPHTLGREFLGRPQTELTSIHFVMQSKLVLKSLEDARLHDKSETKEIVHCIDITHVTAIKAIRFVSSSICKEYVKPPGIFGDKVATYVRRRTDSVFAPVLQISSLNAGRDRGYVLTRAGKKELPKRLTGLSGGC
jgi:hypothetical protein